MSLNYSFETQVVTKKKTTVENQIDNLIFNNSNL